VIFIGHQTLVGGLAVTTTSNTHDKIKDVDSAAINTMQPSIVPTLAMTTPPKECPTVMVPPPQQQPQEEELGYEQHRFAIAIDKMRERFLRSPLSFPGTDWQFTLAQSMSREADGHTTITFPDHTVRSRSLLNDIAAIYRETLSGMRAAIGSDSPSPSPSFVPLPLSEAEAEINAKKLPRDFVRDLRISVSLGTPTTTTPGPPAILIPVTITYTVTVPMSKRVANNTELAGTCGILIVSSRRDDVLTILLDAILKDHAHEGVTSHCQVRVYSVKARDAYMLTLLDYAKFLGHHIGR